MYGAGWDLMLNLISCVNLRFGDYCRLRYVVLGVAPGLGAVFYTCALSMAC